MGSRHSVIIIVDEIVPGVSPGINRAEATVDLPRLHISPQLALLTDSVKCFMENKSDIIPTSSLYVELTIVEKRGTSTESSLVDIFFRVWIALEADCCLHPLAVLPAQG